MDNSPSPHKPARRIACPRGAWYRPIHLMPSWCRFVLAVALPLSLAACRPNIGTINANPDKFYETTVKIRARVSRRQIVGDDALLELADDRERRILALVPADEAPEIGDEFRAKGVLVADRQVGDVLVYDVIVVGGTPMPKPAVTKRDKPWWRFW